MSQRRRTAKNRREETGPDSVPPGAEGTAGGSGRGGTQDGGGRSWLDRVQASAELTNGESESQFFGSEPIGAVPREPGSIPVEPVQGDLPWSRTAEELNEEPDPAPGPVHIVDAESIGPEPEWRHP